MSPSASDIVCSMSSLLLRANNPFPAGRGLRARIMRTSMCYVVGARSSGAWLCTARSGAKCLHLPHCRPRLSTRDPRRRRSASPLTASDVYEFTQSMRTERARCFRYRTTTFQQRPWRNASRPRNTGAMHLRRTVRADQRPLRLLLWRHRLRTCGSGRPMRGQTCSAQTERTSDRQAPSVQSFPRHQRPHVARPRPSALVPSSPTAEVGNANPVP